MGSSVQLNGHIGQKKIAWGDWDVVRLEKQRGHTTSSFKKPISFHCVVFPLSKFFYTKWLFNFKDPLAECELIKHVTSKLCYVWSYLAVTLTCWKENKNLFFFKISFSFVAHSKLFVDRKIQVSSRRSLKPVDLHPSSTAYRFQSQQNQTFACLENEYSGQQKSCERNLCFSETVEVLFGGNGERRSCFLRVYFIETSGGGTWSFDTKRPRYFNEGGEGK